MRLTELPNVGAALVAAREPFMAKLDVLVEFWEFLRYNKKYWIAPIVIFLVLAGLILVLAQASPIAPFIYSIF